MNLRTAGLVIFALANWDPSAWGDEQLTPLATSGAWIAMAHSESMTAPPDLCLAVNVASSIAFRSDGTSVELRVYDKKWSLPPAISGNIKIDVGSYQGQLPIISNTDTMVAVELSSSDVLSIFAVWTNQVHYR